jgi:hypothetical protein
VDKALVCEEKWGCKLVYRDDVVRVKECFDHIEGAIYIPEEANEEHVIERSNG